MQKFLEHFSEYLCFKELFGKSVFFFFKKHFGDYSTCSEKVQRLRDRALPPALEAWRLNCWTPRKVLHFLFLKQDLSFSSLPGRLLICFIYE